MHRLSPAPQPRRLGVLAAVAIALAVFLLAALVEVLVHEALAPPVGSPPPTIHVLQEDEPGWDCATMGNRVCGPDEPGTPEQGGEPRGRPSVPPWVGAPVGAGVVGSPEWPTWVQAVAFVGCLGLGLVGCWVADRVESWRLSRRR